ncbi:MAG: segregation/condensation protein A [Melioribacteraceae bacterium]|nr:segregation/condensation protein A [Melioribacteraceae bacterium]
MYKIKLQNFEGPLDLLLFFIKRDELDIYDIPISYITEEFMKYIELMEKLDLEVAGDFILMAATLMQIKAKMLLPKERDEKGEEIDPRADLIAALLEYKRYKEMAEELSISESNQRKLSFRGYYSADNKEAPEDLNLLLKNVTLYDLMKAFKAALAERPREAVHQIQRLNVTIEEQIEFIINSLDKSNEISFIQLVIEMREKIRIIVTFVALLELVKMGRIGLKESGSFNDFIIYGLEENG